MPRQYILLCETRSSEQLDINEDYTSNPLITSFYFFALALKKPPEMFRDSKYTRLYSLYSRQHNEWFIWNLHAQFGFIFKTFMRSCVYKMFIAYVHILSFVVCCSYFSFFLSLSFFVQKRKFQIVICLFCFRYAIGRNFYKSILCGKRISVNLFCVIIINVIYHIGI